MATRDRSKGCMQIVFKIKRSNP
ncbi:hypothetical protein C359_04045 [Cryptococcus neoformans Bt120]|nr:hypothetical protein C359_04045 [Cryptococcus neoformans var. grubii Bt120]